MSGWSASCGDGEQINKNEPAANIEYGIKLLEYTIPPTSTAPRHKNTWQ